MKSRKIKTEIGEKLKNICESLSEKERKGVRRYAGYQYDPVRYHGSTCFRTFSFSRHTKGVAVWQEYTGGFTPPKRQGQYNVSP